MQTSATDPLVGRTLEGRYRLLERIARGGMSTVYAAVDERLDRSVAVKVMSSALSADPAFSDRFAREARAAARMTHLNTVAVYDQGWEAAADGHHVFLVMELVEGRTLRELLREKHRLSPAEAISIMEPVLSALAAAHRAGIVHRDIKPENILLSDDGVVKVADFGLARAVETDAANTRTGLMMGTVAYCAPEQFTKGVADQRSDVYACGIVLFELLTGQPPFRGDTAINVAYQHVHGRVPAPSSKVRGIPAEIDELVVLTTDPDPGSRPADAGALLAELADVRSELGLPVTPVPPRPRTRQRTAPRETAPTGDDETTDVIRSRTGGGSTNRTSVVPPPGTVGQRAGVGGRALLAGDDGPPPPVVIPPPKRPKQRRRPNRRRRALIIVLVLLIAGAAAGYGTWYLVAGRYAKVPDVIGDSPTQAKQELRQAGYTDVVVLPGPQYDNRPKGTRVAKGAVLHTDPSAGSRVVKTKRISIVLSAGLQQWQLPDVARSCHNQGTTACSPQEARDLLRQVSPLINVVVDVRPENSMTVPSGYLTRTSPAAGTDVTVDDTVTLYQSIGPPIIDVPSIEPGATVADAKATLTKAGFKVVVAKPVPNSSVPPDTVVSVTPNGRAPKGSTITITPCKGVTVPSFSFGSDYDTAAAQLESLGLVPVKHETLPGNRIIGQSPSGGTRVHVGDSVDLYVA
ncbi:MAG: protein kinase domain-containing protein [Jatrophihabitans sp.]|uniref:Stk1 family PASTA domain-containing Ser/Thr kinase n=1 Tax=Jatrophihabitans sp. TaxID=1932789 RepID=UPI003F81F642